MYVCVCVCNFSFVFMIVIDIFYYYVVIIVLFFTMFKLIYSLIANQYNLCACNANYVDFTAICFIVGIIWQLNYEPKPETQAFVIVVDRLWRDMMSLNWKSEKILAFEGMVAKSLPKCFAHFATTVMKGG